MSSTEKFDGRWFTATTSDGVEVAFAADGSIGVRNSKLGEDGHVLEFTPAEWDAFLDGAMKDEFTIPA
ncbi:DUF397 domain-containing protein [Allocatelliglobosispora scoriae]|uniref:DUF397 domain-containing protein n=1 Tax=Allocatelliglobosispora scoriae TaxID=643052 RepID=UPI0016205E8C|nr:DUF397 domain-containing protein [Allocatelliglobosispora scoriae]